MATSEAVPFSKTGGLADVVSALSHSLNALGNDACVVIPFYQDTTVEQTEKMPWVFEIAAGFGVEQVSVYRSVHGGTEFYLLETPLFSSRPGFYGGSSHEPYPDNLYRYTIFDLAVLQLCRAADWSPEVLHCHDWTTGLLPMFLGSLDEERFSQTRSIMTIHNLGYQGDFTKHDLHAAGLSARMLFPESDPVRYEERVNMLRTGIYYADAVTTVSRTYAEEIKTRTMGHGLDELLREKNDVLHGILNGVDYTEWHPEHDQYIPQQYSMTSLPKKAVNKEELQRYCDLQSDPDVPLIGMVSRLADQKGFRELCSGSPSALERILTELNVQVVIVGTGDREIETYLTRMEDLYENFSAHLVFNNYIAHLVEAGADFFLMPSRYEPCGLNQIYSLRYGTLPIVRATGGLADTVTQIDTASSQGDGFVFTGMSGEAIFDAVQEAVNFWQQAPEAVTAARLRAMQMDYSWDNSALEYQQMYREIKKEEKAHV